MYSAGITRLEICVLGWPSRATAPDSCQWSGTIGQVLSRVEDRAKPDAAGALDGFWPTRNNRAAGADATHLVNPGRLLDVNGGPRVSRFRASSTGVCAAGAGSGRGAQAARRVRGASGPGAGALTVELRRFEPRPPGCELIDGSCRGDLFF
jgi:hypothetical protein